MDGKRVLIKTEKLTKKYEQATAVDGLDLEIYQGEVFGLLGPNGAGKTTTILMLMGLTEPTGGTARVAGHDPTREPLAVKRIIGYLPDNVGFYEELTGRENLRYTARLNQLPPAVAEERIGRLLDRVGLGRVADDRVGTYSRGMIQRLGIADVLVKDPRVVILDEPTNGIDPEGIREVLDLIHGLSREDGRTVLISSHLLHQVQQICDRVGIFVEGEAGGGGPHRIPGGTAPGRAAGHAGGPGPTGGRAAAGGPGGTGGHPEAGE
ncbi:MAG: ABC transporter ATP-binding protein [bacterium]